MYSALSILITLNKSQYNQLSSADKKAKKKKEKKEDSILCVLISAVKTEFSFHTLMFQMIKQHFIPKRNQQEKLKAKRREQLFIEFTFTQKKTI